MTHIPEDHRVWIESRTRRSVTPLVPEIQLQLLSDRHDVYAWDPFPYWAFAWGSGQAIARYVLDHSAVVAGRTVLDFGAGSGIAAVAAARAGSARVVAVDVDPLAVSAIAVNAAMNGVVVECCEGSSLPEEGRGIDVLIVSDIFYHWPGMEAVLYRAHCRTVLLAIPERRALAPGRAIPPARLQLLAEYKVRTYPETEIGNVRAASVYRFLPGQEPTESVP